MAPPRQPITGDPVGNDLAERLRPVRVRVELEYQTPKPTGREREAGVPTRDMRVYVFNMNHEAMDPKRGPEKIARYVATHLFRRLLWEGWPITKQRVNRDIRPGDLEYFG